jgi:hypothetical protein
VTEQEKPADEAEETVISKVVTSSDVGEQTKTHADTEAESDEDEAEDEAEDEGDEEAPAT